MLDERKSWAFYYKRELDNLSFKKKVFILDKNLLKIDTKEDMSHEIEKRNYFSKEEKNYKHYSYINEDVFSNRKDMMKYLEEDFVLDLNEFDAFQYKLKRAFVFYFPNSYNPYKKSSKFKTLTSPDWKWTVVAIGVRLNGDVSISNKVFNFEDKEKSIDNILKSIGSKTLCNKRIRSFEKIFEINDLLYSKINKNGKTSETFKDLYYTFNLSIRNGYKSNLENFYNEVCNCNITSSSSLKEYHFFKGQEYRFRKNFSKSLKSKIIESFFIKIPSEIKKSIPSDVKEIVNKTGKYDISLYQWLNNGFKKSRKYRLQAIESFPSFYTTLIKYQKEIDLGSSVTNILVSEFNVSKNIIKKLNGFTNKRTKGLFNEIDKIGPEVYLKVIKSFSIKLEKSEDFKYLYIFVKFLNSMINFNNYQVDPFYYIDHKKEYDNDILEMIDIMKKRPINDIKKYCLDLNFENAFSVDDKKTLFKDGIKLLTNNLLLPYIINENESFKNNVYSISTRNIETYQYIYSNKYIKNMMKNLTLEEMLNYGIKLDKKMSDIGFMNNLYYDDPDFPIIENISKEESSLYSKYNKEYWPGLIKDNFFDEENNVEIIPITSLNSLKEEGRIMDHCVGTTRNTLCYKGESFVFSFRKDGEHIATLDLYMYKEKERKRFVSNNNKIFFEDKRNNIKVVNIEFRGYSNNEVPQYGIKAFNKFKKAFNNGDIKIDYDFLFGHVQYIKRVMDIAPLFDIINFNPLSDDAQYAVKRRFDEFLTKKERKMSPLDFQKSILL